MESFSPIQNNITLKLPAQAFLGKKCFSPIQNNITLKLLLNIEHSKQCFSPIQNNITLKPSSSFKCLPIRF